MYSLLSCVGVKINSRYCNITLGRKLCQCSWSHREDLSNQKIFECVKGKIPFTVLFHAQVEAYQLK